MNDWRRPPALSVNIDWPFAKIPLSAGLAAMGSCFADEIAGRLFEAGFKGARNPAGIVYNAVSMAEAAERAVDGPAFSPADFFELDGLFQSWSHHGSFSAKSVEEAVAKAEAARLAFREALKSCSLFLATPASSVVYELADSGRIVANCHKAPGGLFKRRLLSVEENLSALTRLCQALRRLNESCLIVFTLSPVRHYPGDLVLNARSKAHLLTALHLCREAFERVAYFPAFELVIDELRDYRFFKEDMTHPNETAVEIVLKTFASTCFEDGVLEALDKAGRVRRSSCHRPMKGN